MPRPGEKANKGQYQVTEQLIEETCHKVAIVNNHLFFYHEDGRSM
jgi:hypothetical protein